LTLFIHLSTLFGILVPWLYPFESFASKLLFISLNGSTVLILLNYYLCVVVDPGFVSPSYKPPPTTSAHLTPIVQTPNNVDPSNDTLTPFFCDRCQLYKPPRAHHCRQCNRCILRMDHHCVWIASCVGFKNQPHFVRFLFWTCVSCWICIVVLIMRLESVLFGVVHGQKQLEMQETVGELIIVGINFVVLTPTVSILTMLAYNQFHLLLTNQTTIESLNQSKRASFAYSGKRVDLSFHPYDLGGWIDNVNQVLGSNMFSWL
ncbi:DHHC palmitoyltransferase-domain-containing protein, partial [Obelidium mucronatum]